MPNRLIRALLFGGLIGLASPPVAYAGQPAPNPAAAALARLGLPPGRVTTRIVASPNPSYRVTIADGRITAQGSSPVAIVHGVAQVLQRQGQLSINWDGNRIGSLRDLRATDTGNVTSRFALRNYLNTCTFGYTTPWWDWPRWSRQIDWMAARGVDSPLAMEGQEAVWDRLWREQGLSDGEVARSLSAAPFLPWQRMGNIAGYRAPLSRDWIAKKARLQKRILTRMRELGMRPILPAFSGYVPQAFAKRHPHARIYRMREWEGFPPTYWLDPADPLFAAIARRFIELYTQLYGPGEFYLADAFNEMVPPIADDGSDVRAAAYGDATANAAPARAASIPPAIRDARLAAYGERIYRSIAAAAPNATWVMQGWLFGADQAFWTPDAIKAFLSRVPSERMLILDIGNDRYPGVWTRTSAFNGKGWSYGYVHNYGGSNPVYGDLEFYRREIAAVQESPARGNLQGFGMFPEGLNNNPVVYAYSYDLAWGERGDRPVEAWLGEYLAARYGVDSPQVREGWGDAVRGVYRTAYWSPRWWRNRAGAYLFFKRPTLEGPEFGPVPGDRAALRQGLDKLLAASSSVPSALFKADLVDFARHYATLALDDELRRAIAAYGAGRIAEGDRARASVERLAKLIDALLGNQQETLGSWIADAQAYAGNPADRRSFAVDAKTIVTIWGGEGHLSDYASRAWQGLYRGYYLPRWQMFLAAQRQAALAGKPLAEDRSAAEIRAWETAWLNDGRTWPRQRPADPVALVRKILREVDSAR